MPNLTLPLTTIPFTPPAAASPPDPLPSLPRPPVPAGPRIKASIRELLSEHLYKDRKLEKAVVDLTRNLVAMKLHFPDMLEAREGDPPDFTMRAPLTAIQVSRQRVGALLADLEPGLAARQSVLDDILRIVGAAGPYNRDMLSAHRFPMMCIDPGGAPTGWPAETVLTLFAVCDWSKIDFSYADLSGLTNHGALRQGLDLRNANLQNSYWRGSDLRNSDLRGSNLKGAAMYDCNLEGAQLGQCNLEDADLRRCNLKGADLRKCNFKNADLRHAELKDATASDAVFDGANMTGVYASGTDFKRASLVEADLSAAVLTLADMEDAVGLCCSSGTVFSGAKLRNARLAVRKTAPAIDHGRRFWRDFAPQPDLGAYRKKQFEALASIDKAQYPDCYIEAVRGLIDCIKNTHHPSAPIALKHWLDEPACWTDAGVNAYICRELLAPLLVRWNENRTHDGDPTPERLIQYLGETQPALDWQEYRAAIHKLIAMPVTLSLMASQKALRDMYVNSPGTARNGEPGVSAL
jgi:uncharacterized protein YjbI with pentapeptide repeats